MTPSTNCNQNTDPLKLVREGTSQDQRLSPALDPAYAPVNERTPAYGMVFGQAYSAFLKYYDFDDVHVDSWKQFFSKDVSVQLAVASIQDVNYYKANVKSYFDFLNNLDNETNATALKENLGYLFSTLATLAQQLDQLKDELPSEIALKGALQNLIQSQLAPAFQRLIAYYKADLALPLADRLIADTQPGTVLFGDTTAPFSTIYGAGLSSDWITDGSPDWATYTSAVPADDTVYGSGTTVFEKTNHISTHNLFVAIFNQFLKVFARVVGDAQKALEPLLPTGISTNPITLCF